jgi:hypothetical protein
LRLSDEPGPASIAFSSLTPLPTSDHVYQWARISDPEGGANPFGSST